MQTLVITLLVMNSLTKSPLYRGEDHKKLLVGTLEKITMAT